MKVVLFCGGLGVRMGHASRRTPKPMITVGDRPIVWHIMSYYAAWGFTDFVLCLGHKAAAIEGYFRACAGAASNGAARRETSGELELAGPDGPGWRITFVDSGPHATIGDRLLSAAPYIDDDYFLATYGDGLTDAPLDDMIGRLEASGKTGMFMSVRPPFSAHVVDVAEGGAVRSITSIQRADVWINGGFFVFRRDVLDAIRPGEELVEEPFGRLIDRGELIGYRYEGFFGPMDTMKDKQVLDALAANGAPPWSRVGLVASLAG